ncbi:odorant-binding protein 2b-like [Rhynchocyon petersi]
MEAQDPLLFAWEEKNITGTWYVKAVVGDKGLPWENMPKKVSPVMVTIRQDGDLETSFTFMKNGQCHEKRIVMESQGEPGKYSAFGGTKYIFLQELPMMDHYIIYCKGIRDGKTLRMGKLLGMNPDMNREAMEEFRKFAQQKGFPQENIFTLDQIVLGQKAYQKAATDKARRGPWCRQEE